MELTRRQFMQAGAMGIGALAAPAAFAKLGKPIAAGALNSYSSLSSSCWVLNRIGYGGSPAERQTLAQMGYKDYLEQQFHPVNEQDTLCNEKLSKATLHIEYKAGDGYPALTEDRPLMTLGMPVEELWPLSDNANKMDGNERSRPAQEVRAATWIRAVYSKWQLREVMAEFWHNHFNVHAFGSQPIMATFPLYDSIMRKHCFGNFRAFLEDVAQSTAMQYYLNNVQSKASPANENYARELFELHTLGADHYYNNLYNRWREVPGAQQGKPIGYIDQDVYEAARAFTGWTIENGTNTGRGTIFPKTGKFVYFDGWHDNYQKRLLGVEFDPNSPPMADGRKVLDLVAAHPGTAINLCTKLCRRFVSDDPPASLIKKAAATWQANVKSPDQIKRVLEVILLSPEFAASDGRKVKRPLEYIISFLRTTQADIAPNLGIFGTLSATGYRQFEWPTPTGHPDVAEYWLNSNTTLGCWNLAAQLAGGGFNKAATFDLAAQTPLEVKTSGEIIAYWVERMTGRKPDELLTAELMQYMPQPNNPSFTPDIHNAGFKQPYQQMVMAVAMLPDFQVR